MKKYRQPKAGTPDALDRDATKLVNVTSNPMYKRIQYYQEQDKKYFRGKTNNEWQ